MSTYDISFEPEKLIDGIVCRSYGTELTPEEEETLKDVKHWGPQPAEKLCRACGWDTEHETTSSYLPRLRIFDTKVSSGLWTMGNDWMVWDRPSKFSGNDYMSWKFLTDKKVKDVPLVKHMSEFADENGGYNFVVMSRAKGVPLHSVWHGLKGAQKRAYTEQMKAALREMRSLKADYPQRADGSPLWDCIVARSDCDGRNCIKVGRTTEEWLKNMEPELREGISRFHQTRDKAVIDAKLAEITVSFICAREGH